MIVVCTLACLAMTGSFGSALSAWNESAPDFQKGERVNTRADSDGLRLETVAESNDNWTKVADGTPCPGRPGLIAYDSANGRLLLLQGSYNYPFQNTQWTYSFGSKRWTEAPALGCPPYNANSWAAMAYDSRLGRIVLFMSSYDPDPAKAGQTWAYDVGNATWMNLSPPSSPPVTSYSSVSMVYDSAAGVMVLLRTDYYCCTRGETWTYDPGANTWTNMSPADGPCGKYYQALAYDSVNDILVSFGRFGDYPYMSETWTYKLSTNTWTNKTPLNTPMPRDRHTLAFDTLTSQVVLFGGNRMGTTFGDTWTYNTTANDWTERFPDYRNKPSDRSGHSMAYDSADHLAVIWGGNGDWPENGEFWAYNASAVAWTDLSPADQPCCRIYPQMAFDAASGEAVLFGGGKGTSESTAFNDTYTFNLSTGAWKNKNPNPSPPGGRGYVMAYDSTFGAMVLFAARDEHSQYGQTWSYDLEKNAWTDKNPVTVPSFCGCMAYDSKNKVMVMLGGQAQYPPLETWTYDMAANTWTNHKPAATPSSFGCMAYDSAAGEMVLFTGKRETWTYNVSLNSWTNRMPGAAPPSEGGSAMVYDVADDQMVLFGGYYGGMDRCHNETWSYNLSKNSWMKKEPAVSPSARAWPAMAYDEAQDLIMLFGGAEGDAFQSSTRSDSWVLDPGGLQDSGTYTSAPFDTGGDAYFGSLEWDADVPARTSMKLQLRTADRKEQLAGEMFVGPDRDDRTYYQTSGEPINETHNGSRWVQYRALLRSRDPPASSVLSGVTVNYNLRHSLNVTSPILRDNWTGIHSINWSADDPDNDSLAFDIYLENYSAKVPLARNLTSGARQWLWDTDQCQNGTYRIRIVARDDNPSIPLAVSGYSGQFRIQHPGQPAINRLPHVDLLHPANNTVVNATSVSLHWHGTDPDDDPLTYTVSYFSPALSGGQAQRRATALETLELTELADHTTYYWTVEANDTKTNLTDTQTPVWQFSVKLLAVNHPPGITSVPVTAGTVGQLYQYNITAEDGDHDALLFSLVSGPPNMTIDGMTGALRWRPAADDLGYRTVMVEVSDGRGGTDRQTFIIAVREEPPPPPAERPVCRIFYPANGSTVNGLVKVRGTAARGTATLVIVRLRIDGGEWTTVLGLENWSLVIDTGRLVDGKHRIEARSFDGSLYSDTVSIEISVHRPDSRVSVEPFPFLAALIIGAAAFLGLYVYLRNRPKR